MKTYNKTIEAVSPLATQEQSWIRRQDGKERGFRKEYWDNNEPELYVDVVSGEVVGEPLFASADKFDGGTGFRPSPKSRLRSPSPISRRYVENLFVVGASVYPFNAGDNPIAL
jgi:peptide methionine sulfoxide reductase MsrB